MLSLPQLDVNMLAPDEGTGALHKACEKGHIDYVKMMLERKEIDVDLQNKVKKRDKLNITIRNQMLISILAWRLDRQLSGYTFAQSM